MIAPADENLHAAGPERHWQESYYFNWFDPTRGYFGLTRIGFRPSEGQVDAIVVAILDGHPQYIYPGVNLDQRGQWSELSVREGLRAGRLVYEMEEPLERWRLRREGRNATDLTWDAFTAPHDYRADGRAMPDNLAASHFEQTGRIHGWTEFRGYRLEVDGTGQRDKSWGVRDWARVEGWNWISAQFGQEVSFNAWEGSLAGRRHVGGYVFRDGQNHAIEELEVELTWGPKSHVPRASRLRILDSSGTESRVTGQAIGQCGLVKRGHFVQETPSTFWLHWGGNARHGVGVVEHTWHAGTLGTLRRAPGLVATALRAMRP